MKNKGQSVPREGKDMSNFNDLYDHVAADRTRAIQLLGIQDIRRKAIAELLAANAYTEPANIDAMTDAEREQHKAEAAYALGRPHILEVAQVPAPNSDETYAMAVGATSEHPNCIALCIQTKLEELYMSGIVERSATHHPRLFVVAANDAPDEDVQGLSAALDMLRVTYPDFQIVLNERTPEQAMRAALSDELRDALAVFHGLRLGAVVLQKHPQLSAVIGIDHADAVGRAQPLPGCQPAAREHAAEIPRRNGEGKPRADHGRRVRRDRDALPVRRAGVEIIARRVRAAAPRGDGAGAQLPDLHFHPFMPSQSTMCPAARVQFMSMMRWFSEPRKRRLRLRCAST